MDFRTKQQEFNIYGILTRLHELRLQSSGRLKFHLINVRIKGTEHPRSVQKHESHSEKKTFYWLIHSEIVLD